ncbi:MAG: NAD-dependent epimerase/dehydratase family protein [Chloroflexi bacterium]|nr:NAD-dependent epimerase/dehydratase family protein [Chloroflexota bacterium]
MPAAPSAGSSSPKARALWAGRHWRPPPSASGECTPAWPARASASRSSPPSSRSKHGSRGHETDHGHRRRRRRHPLRILVTGGAGFVGSHAVDLLDAHGYQVLVLDNLATGRVFTAPNTLTIRPPQ